MKPIKHAEKGLALVAGGLFNTIQFFNQFDNGNGFQFLAGANIQDGQVVWSPFTIFGSDNFGIILQDPANAQVSWNLTNTGGY